MGLAKTDHGNLQLAYTAFARAQQDMASNLTMPTDVQSMILVGLKMTLAACALHARAKDFSPDNQRLFAMLQAQQLLPLYQGPPPIAAGGDVCAGAAQPPAEQEEASGSAGGSKKKRTKGGGRWWEAPLDAEWRLESWVRHNPNVPRFINVKLGPKLGWAKLPYDSTQRLLKFYDSGKLGDTLPGILGNEQNNHYYDYKIEGGKWLSQNNTHSPGSNPRECHILYGSSVPVETEWSNKSWSY